MVNWIKTEPSGAAFLAAPATQIPDDADVVVCHTGLAGAARNAAPEGSVLIQFTMFMNDPNLKKLITDISEDNEITSSWIK